MPELFPGKPNCEIANPAPRTTQTIPADDRAREGVQFIVLKCALIFLSELIRHLAIPEKDDFANAVSYGYGN
jgi:hypoxanthine-guanine phosphoribosyltransferase